MDYLTYLGEHDVGVNLLDLLSSLRQRRSKFLAVPTPYFVHVRARYVQKVRLQPAKKCPRGRHSHKCGHDWIRAIFHIRSTYFAKIADPYPDPNTRHTEKPRAREVRRVPRANLNGNIPGTRQYHTGLSSHIEDLILVTYTRSSYLGLQRNCDQLYSQRRINFGGDTLSTTHGLLRRSFKVIH